MTRTIRERIEGIAWETVGLEKKDGSKFRVDALFLPDGNREIVILCRSVPNGGIVDGDVIERSNPMNTTPDRFVVLDNGFIRRGNIVSDQIDDYYLITWQKVAVYQRVKAPAQSINIFTAQGSNARINYQSVDASMNSSADVSGQPKKPKQRSTSSLTSRERQLKKDLALSRRMKKDLLRPLQGPPKNQWDKFAYCSVIIRSVEDTSYPDNDDSEGISGWFRVELWDFYFDGLEVLLMPFPGVIDNEGNWAILESKQSYDKTKYERVRIVRTGRIPYRNIVDYIMRDEYYNEPHLYCRYADNGEPYADKPYYIERGELYWPLDAAKLIELDSRKDT